MTFPAVLHLLRFQVFILLALPTAVEAFTLDNHRNILMQALYYGTLHYGDSTVSFSLEAIQDLDAEQGALDRVDALIGDPIWHFDDEKLQESNKNATELRATAIERLKNSSLDTTDVKSARNAVGRGLHLIQDFYAHTNWVEMGKGDLNPDLGMRSLQDSLADVSTKVCADNGAYIVGTRKLTSGYPKKVPPGKCAHGNSSTGLNKDTAGKTGFDQAKKLAIKATQAYVESILNEPQVLNNKAAVKQFTGR